MILSCGVSFSQLSEKAAGVNLFTGTLHGAELCYQQKVTKIGLADLKLGYGKISDFTQVRFSANYDFVYQYEAYLNIYAGPGFTTGVSSYKERDEELSTKEMVFNLSANIAAEYYLPAPLKITLLFKPELNMKGYGGEFTGGLMLSYIFN